MNVRQANQGDIDAVETIYSDTHTAEENGMVTIGWVRGVYPTRLTAEEALDRGDLFVMEDGGEIVGAAAINRVQVAEYVNGKWEHDAPENEVMVLHTLVISPRFSGRGYGKAFVNYYEGYAKQNGCPYLRMDTNAKNQNARAMYKKLGYREAGITPCDFNGIENVQLVLLEKKIG